MYYLKIRKDLNRDSSRLTITDERGNEKFSKDFSPCSDTQTVDAYVKALKTARQKQLTPLLDVDCMTLLEGE